MQVANTTIKGDHYKQLKFRYLSGMALAAPICINYFDNQLFIHKTTAPIE